MPLLVRLTDWVVVVLTFWLNVRLAGASVVRPAGSWGADVHVPVATGPPSTPSASS